MMFHIAVSTVQSALQAWARQSNTTKVYMDSWLNGRKFHATFQNLSVSNLTNDTIDLN
jgi:hypothetical protein